MLKRTLCFGTAQAAVNTTDRKDLSDRGRAAAAALSASLALLGVFSPAAMAQSAATSAVSSGAVFGILQGGSNLRLGTGNNANDACRLSFFDSPQVEVVAPKFLSQGRCSSVATQGGASTQITASGNYATKKSLPAFSVSSSGVNVSFTNSNQVSVSGTAGISGNTGSVTPTGSGATEPIVKTNNLLTVPAGNYGDISVQNGTNLVLKGSDSKSTLIKNLSLSGCNGAGLELGAGAFHIENLQVQAGCNIRLVAGGTATNLYIKNGFNLNGGLTCVNMGGAACGNAPFTRASLADQRPDLLNIFVYNGNVQVQANVRIAANLYLDNGSLDLQNGNGSVFVGQAVAEGITAQNNAGTVYAFKGVTQVVPLTPPVISLAVPQDYVTQIRPVISAKLQDDDGIDTSKTILQLDGQTVTGAQVSNAAISYTPVSDLAQGQHLVVVTAIDIHGAASTVNWRFDVDTVGPSITAPQPKDANVSSAVVNVTAQLADLGSGINVNGIQVLLDGQDVSAQTTKTTSSLSYRPAVLASGSHTVVVKASDMVGNLTQSTWSFTVDGQGPLITFSSPANNAILAADALPTITAQYVDALEGVEISSVQLELDGVDITVAASKTASGLTFAPLLALTEGVHTVKLSVKDRAGNASSRTLNFKTATAPVIGDVSPVNGTIFPTGSGVIVMAKLSDVGSGIDTTATRLIVDSLDVTSSASVNDGAISYSNTNIYAVGPHQVELFVADKAGNQTTTRWTFDIDQPATTVFSNLIPSAAILPSGSLPTMSAAFSDSTGINPASVRLFVDEVDVTSQATVTSTGVAFVPTSAMAAGRHMVYLRVTNGQGRIASTIWSFEIDTPVLYTMNFVEPSSAKAINQAEVNVKVRAASDRYDVDSVQVNGQSLGRESGTAREGIYAGIVTIARGDSVLTAAAKYADGQTKQSSLAVNYSVPPEVRITVPADKTTLGQVNPNSPLNLTGNVDRPVTIVGTLDKAVMSVMVNQQQAVVNGLEFRFDNFFLHEGNNFISAVATDAQGRVGNTSIIVSVDQTAPLLGVESPAANSVTSANSIDVRGTVNDAVAGYYGATHPTVIIGSAKGAVTALVDDKQFLATNVPLEIGENLLTVTATDQVGNARSTQFKVVRTATASERLAVYAGHLQSAQVTQVLPQPLVVSAIDAAGKPLSGAVVVFEVARGTGFLSATQPAAGTVGDSSSTVRRLSVTADAQGLAQVWHTLGKQSGPGSDAITARVSNIAESAVFIATATKSLPKFVRADLGVNQFVATNSQPLEPLTAVVIDEFENRIGGAVVTFKVVIGTARFDNGSDTMTATTDRQGLAALRPTVGAEAGEVLIYATVEGAPPRGS